METVPLGRGFGEVTARARGEPDDGEPDDGGLDGAADAMLTPSATEVLFPIESLTTNVKVLAPAFCGVPDRRPDGLNPRPVLQAPEHCAIDQVYGEVPPLAVSEAL